MSLTRIEHLIGLYFSNSITEIENEELANLVVQLTDEEIQALLEKEWTKYEPDTKMPDDISTKIITSFFKDEIPAQLNITNEPVLKINHNRNWWRIITAAACIIAFVTITFFLLKSPEKKVIAKKAVPQKQIPKDIQPGGQKAMLTLADGSQIILDSASSGLLARQGNAQVIKLSKGEISYNTNGSAHVGLLYNTMSTPVGGIYQLILPDGTNVWLNSASSIRYPTEFTTNERRVQITGEAYFEVVKNADKPFVVTVNNLAEIKVLGTHFNVNAYTDEAEIRTTLLEGAIDISKGNNSTKLAPGQQAQINTSGFIKRVDNADLDEAVAWKNGNFLFNSTALPAILRQAARWYDLEIVYAGKIPTDKFSGQISRSVRLSSLLKWMEWSDVHFTLEGKKLIINP
ncbi:MAG: FecR family protein [Ginsengibacter sp.]